MGTNCLSNVQFFQLCEAIRNKREQVAACTKRSEVRALLKLDFTPAESSIKDAMEAVGIELAVKKNGFTEDKRIKTAKVLARALVHLYEKLGETIPPGLAELADRIESNVGLSTGTPKPVPISSVPNPKTISIVKEK